MVFSIPSIPRGSEKVAANDVSFALTLHHLLEFGSVDPEAFLVDVRSTCLANFIAAALRHVRQCVQGDAGDGEFSHHGSECVSRHVLYVESVASKCEFSTAKGHLQPPWTCCCWPLLFSLASRLSPAAELTSPPPSPAAPGCLLLLDNMSVRMPMNGLRILLLSQHICMQFAPYHNTTVHSTGCFV
jgi:hypothetical protein